MKLLDVLDAEAILPDLNARTKSEALEELATPVARSSGAALEELVRVLLDRERLGSTGIGGGIGIPHGKIFGIDRLFLGFGRSRQGIDFESLDGRPTRIFFLLVTPESSAGLHLKVLARISRLLKDESFKERLLQADSRAQIAAVIQGEDEDF
ncbi:MAG: PTS sugar transporter subunit IIA [Desulfobacterales bacterium]|jgi:PTS system nitrogen regulatory IIA component|nr:PTS sugar transporter subunit IIA [Desulfobacterales bacterium]